MIDRAKSILRNHLRNIPGKSVKRRFVVIESDDWGSERIPNLKAKEYLESLGADLVHNPFNRIDTLESAIDLSELFIILKNYADHNGNPPVITANTVTANPDFNKVEASGFSRYFYEPTSETYAKKPGCESNMDIIRQGISDNLFYPQFHGREHVNFEKWLFALRSGNRTLAEAFNYGVYGIDIPNPDSARDNYMAAFDSYLDADIRKYREIIKEGMELFSNTFGFESKSFIAPCYVWHPGLENILERSGIQYLQGLPYQFVPQKGNHYKKVFHSLGQTNKQGQIYLVRNCFFEPSINPSFDWVSDCLNRMKYIFRWKKPVIIGTHRINYVGGLDESNRKNNLEKLGVLLKGILKNWPDVEFIASDRLGDYYKNTI
jgi:hypothetical protein